jgi:hypothetical protein
VSRGAFERVDVDPAIARRLGIGGWGEIYGGESKDGEDLYHGPEQVSMGWYTG